MSLNMSLNEALASNHPLTPLEVTLLGRGTLPMADRGQQLSPPSSPAEPLGQQKLPDPILVLIAKNFIDHPKDVFHLAFTNRKLYGWLKLEMYRTEVLRTKEQERATLLVKAGMTPDPAIDVHLDIEQRVSQVLDTVTASLAEPEERWEHYALRQNIPEKYTALHHAASKGNKAVATRLINASARYWPGYIDAKANNCTALIVAVYENHQEIVELLVASGCFVDTWVTELKGSRKFVRDNSCRFVRGLEVQNEFYVNERTMWSPLSYAVATHRLDQALFLAQHTRDAGLVPTFAGDEVKLQVSALHLAAFAGMKGVVKTLLDRGYHRDMRSVLFKDATALEMAATGVDNNYAVMELLRYHEAGRETRRLAWRRAIAHCAPKNAIVILRRSWEQGRLPPLNDEARLCLASDDLLPVLKFIMEHDKMPAQFCADLKEAALELIGTKQGVPSATYRYLRSRGIFSRRRRN